MTFRIEFMGIPGSGKSTLATEVSRHLKAHGHKAMDLTEAIGACIKRQPSDKMLRGILGIAFSALGPGVAKRVFSRSQDRFLSLTEFLSAYPALGEKVLSSQAVTGIDSNRRLWVFKWFFQFFAGFQFTTDRLTDDEILIMEEGFCQKVVTLFAFRSYESREQLRSDIAGYLDQIPMPNIVVNIDSTVAECDARMNNLRWSRAQGWYISNDASNESETRAILERSKLVIEFAVEHISHRGIEIHNVDNTGLLENSKEAIKELVERVSKDHLRSE